MLIWNSFLILYGEIRKLWSYWIENIIEAVFSIRLKIKWIRWIIKLLWLNKSFLVLIWCRNCSKIYFRWKHGSSLCSIHWDWIKVLVNKWVQKHNIPVVKIKNRSHFSKTPRRVKYEATTYKNLWMINNTKNTQSLILTSIHVKCSKRHLMGIKVGIGTNMWFKRYKLFFGKLKNSFLHMPKKPVVIFSFF